MIVPQWAGRYVGIPFHDTRYDLGGSNCWGIVYQVFKTERAIELATYAELSAADLIAASRQFRDGAASEPWLSVIPPARAFDVVLMSAMTDMNGVSRRVPGHVGVMLSPDALLHVWKATDSVIMPLDHPRIRHRILGFFRHKELA